MSNHLRIILIVILLVAFSALVVKHYKEISSSTKGGKTETVADNIQNTPTKEATKDSAASTFTYDEDYKLDPDNDEDGEYYGWQGIVWADGYEMTGVEPHHKCRIITLEEVKKKDAELAHIIENATSVLRKIDGNTSADEIVNRKDDYLIIERLPLFLFYEHPDWRKSVVDAYIKKTGKIVQYEQNKDNGIVYYNSEKESEYGKTYKCYGAIVPHYDHNFAEKVKNTEIKNCKIGDITFIKIIITIPGKDLNATEKSIYTKRCEKAKEQIDSITIKKK